ncbi:MAG: HD domain-containing protein [Bacteroidia bacterium]
MERLIQDTIAYVKAQLATAEAGHDWQHVQRVYRLSMALAEEESADKLIVALSALLHDVADAKFHGGDESRGPALADSFLAKQQLLAEDREHVVNIIRFMSYKGGHNEGKFYSKEFAVVRDADRLDALGAIGIARAFHYGGFKNRALYNPEIAPQPGQSREAYKNSEAPTLNHFYEKLFLLRDGMLTASGKRMAEQRHAFMEQFVEQFKREWHGD